MCEISIRCRRFVRFAHAGKIPSRLNFFLKCSTFLKCRNHNDGKRAAKFNLRKYLDLNFIFLELYFLGSFQITNI